MTESDFDQLQLEIDRVMTGLPEARVALYERLGDADIKKPELALKYECVTNPGKFYAPWATVFCASKGPTIWIHEGSHTRDKESAGKEAAEGRGYGIEYALAYRAGEFGRLKEIHSYYASPDCTKDVLQGEFNQAFILSDTLLGIADETITANPIARMGISPDQARNLFMEYLTKDAEDFSDQLKEIQATLNKNQQLLNDVKLEISRRYDVPTNKYLY